MKKLIVTEDGSHSFFVPEIGESYHSVHGAIQESLHVFIEAGLKKIEAGRIRVFEMGFGTGLNALLTMDYARRSGKVIIYDTIELYPLSPEEVSAINYPELLDLPRTDFEALHSCAWGTRLELEPYFSLLKIKADMMSFIPEGPYDMIFFDAFSPEVQPDLWENHIFKRLFSYMSAGGILTSYSVKGAFRRSLMEAGFEVEKIKGPPGKRHITRATRT